MKRKRQFHNWKYGKQERFGSIQKFRHCTRCTKTQRLDDFDDIIESLTFYYPHDHFDFPIFKSCLFKLQETLEHFSLCKEERVVLYVDEKMKKG